MGKTIKELQTRIKEVQQEIIIVEEKKHEVYQTMISEYRRYEKQLTEFLALPKQFEVTDLYIAYNEDVRFSVIAFDENDKKLFCTESSIYYEIPTRFNSLKKSRIGVNKGTCGTMYEDDEIRILDANVYVRLLNNLGSLKVEIEKMLNSLKPIRNQFHKLSDELTLLENASLSKLEDEIFEIEKNKYLKENNNIIEFNSRERINFRNGRDDREAKIEIVKQLPKGDYRINVFVPENMFMSAYTYHEYITQYELDRLIKLKLDEREEL